VLVVTSVLAFDNLHISQATDAFLNRIQQLVAQAAGLPDKQVVILDVAGSASSTVIKSSAVFQASQASEVQSFSELLVTIAQSVFSSDPQTAAYDVSVQGEPVVENTMYSEFLSWPEVSGTRQNSAATRSVGAGSDLVTLIKSAFLLTKLFASGMLGKATGIGLMWLLVCAMRL